MKKQTSIAVITCWYGSYPWYFSYFIHSCSFNSSVDFYIITDNLDAIPDKPDNVKIIFKTLEEIKTSASDKLGFKVCIDNPFKLCDFKPAYGFLFSEIIKGYNFWAQSDLDVIFGDIRGFLSEEVLASYDFISMRHDYTTGCFALYRNNEKMNTYFMKSIHYKLVFSNAKHYCFDECSFAWDELTSGKSIFEVPTEIMSFTHLIISGAITKDIKAHFDFILMEGKTGQMVFDKGKIIYKSKFEAILYHLFWMKKIYLPKTTPKNIPDTYHISPTRFYHSRNKK
ncbi:MAG: hypothetical protein C0412_10030 [Flavobacterium sp.]|nr:hypothetical protein [Flavobacterium sp.]